MSEVFNPKDRPIKARRQDWRYLNPGSQAALRHMMRDCARVQKSTVGRRDKHEDDVKKYQ